MSSPRSCDPRGIFLNHHEIGENQFYSSGPKYRHVQDAEGHALAVLGLLPFSEARNPEEENPWDVDQYFINRLPEKIYKELQEAH